jgi:hypothetical protein
MGRKKVRLEGTLDWCGKVRLVWKSQTGVEKSGWEKTLDWCGKVRLVCKRGVEKPDCEESRTGVKS